MKQTGDREYVNDTTIHSIIVQESSQDNSNWLTFRCVISGLYQFYFYFDCVCLFYVSSFITITIKQKKVNEKRL